MLNADQAGRPGGVSRSVDLDDLPLGTPPLQPSSPGTIAAHRNAITQSMPAFNRATLRQIGQRPRRAPGTAAPPGLEPTPESRPGTAVRRSHRAPLFNPRSPGSLQLHECFIAPDVRSRLQPSSATGSLRHTERSLDGDDLVEQGSMSACSAGPPRHPGAVELLNQEARNDRVIGLAAGEESDQMRVCLLYTSPSPRD